MDTNKDHVLARSIDNIWYVVEVSICTEITQTDVTFKHGKKIISGFVIKKGN